MHEAGSILIDVSVMGPDARFDRRILEAFGHRVMVCPGPGDGTCPLLAGERCELVERAHGVLFELDLDVPAHRDILSSYEDLVEEDIPILVLVKPGQDERYAELLAKVDKVWTEPPSAADLDAFSARVEAYDRIAE